MSKSKFTESISKKKQTKEKLTKVEMRLFWVLFEVWIHYQKVNNSNSKCKKVKENKEKKKFVVLAKY